MGNAADPKVHQVYLIPGMFGFARLAGYEYFGHVEQALAERFERAGQRLNLHVVPTPPTASIRRRARVVAETIGSSCGDDDGPIHLLGHSTGGLDARLLASPSLHLQKLPEQATAWRSRLQTVVTMNTPHYGTPLAQFFATVSGTRLLYALSLMTVTTLSLGGLPLTALSTLIAGAGRVDEALGIDVHLLDRITELLLRFIGEQGREEVRTWLEGIYRDQGGIIQISPEAMDLFNAAAEDASDVRYGCLAASAPRPAPKRFVRSVRSPYAALSATIYSTVHTVASQAHRHYPYPAPDAERAELLQAGIGRSPSDRLSDGIVPTLSMLWGELLWCGQGDHLDVVGHFRDDAEPAVHTDWLSCGAHFGRAQFHGAMDAISRFLLDE
jgi:hypothetical protein